MRQKIISVAILGGLLLVGGGCFNKSAPVTPTLLDDQTSFTTEAIPEDVDSAVADIIKTIDNEVGVDDEADDVSALNEGSAEVADFYDSTYEVE